jgi:hypothetical protein
MLNAAMVNANLRILRRRISANLFPLLPRFHDSKIRLNIRADLKLTIGRCISRRQAAPRNGVLLCDINVL